MGRDLLGVCTFLTFLPAHVAGEPAGGWFPDRPSRLHCNRWVPLLNSVDVDAEWECMTLKEVSSVTEERRFGDFFFFFFLLLLVCIVKFFYSWYLYTKK